MEEYSHGWRGVMLWEKACVGYDISQLEDDDMYSSSEDRDENGEEGREGAPVRTCTAKDNSFRNRQRRSGFLPHSHRNGIVGPLVLLERTCLG